MTSPITGATCVVCEKLREYSDAMQNWVCEAFPRGVPDNIRLLNADCPYQEVQEVIRRAWERETGS